MLAVVCLAFISLLVVCSAAWVITSIISAEFGWTDWKRTDNSWIDVYTSNAVAEDTSDYFTSGDHKDAETEESYYIYDAKSKEPVLTLAGAQALYGDKQGDLSDAEFLAQMNGATTRPYTVQWEAGTFYNEEALKKAMFTDDYAEYRGVIAGTHYYRIIDKATSSVICYKHAVTIRQDELEAVEESAKRAYAVNETLNNIELKWTTKNHKAYSVPQELKVTFETFTISEDMFPEDYKYSEDASYYPAEVTATSAELGVMKNQGDAADKLREIFKNNYSNAETVANAKFKFEILALCRDSEGIYYPTVCIALDKVSSGTIYAEAIVPHGDNKHTAAHTPADGQYGFDHLICHNREVKSGVKLLLPYSSANDDGSYKGEYGTYFTSSGDYDKPEQIHASKADYGFVDAETAYTQEKTYLKNSITLKDGVTLVNNGTVIVPGVVTGGGGGESINSATVREHSRIYLGSNSTIENTGTIICHGYIDEIDDNDPNTDTNGSKILATGGSIEVVLSIVEHRGGSAFSRMATGTFSKKMEDCAPFNRFYTETVTSEMIVQEGAVVSGYYDMYVSTHWSGSLPFFGTDDKCFIKFNTDDDKKSQVSLKYDKNLKQNKMTVEGSVSVNEIGMTITVTFVSVDLSTGDVFLPISHYWNICFDKFNAELNKDIAEFDDSATVTATGQRIKIMPGASITIGEGVTFEGSEIAVYDTSVVITNATTAINFSYYAKADEDAKSDFDETYGMTNGVYDLDTGKTPPKTYSDGVLMVNGVLNATALGGCVQTKVEGATLNIESRFVESKEVDTVIRNSSTDTDVNFTTKTLYAKGVVQKGTSADLIVMPDGITEYVSVGDAWAYKREITVHYDLNDNSFDPATAIADKSETLWSNEGIELTEEYLTAPLRNNYTFYTFVGWRDANGNIVSATDPPTTVYSDTTLVAEWNDRDDLKGTIIHKYPERTISQEFNFSTDGTKLLPDNYSDPTNGGYKLQGWYLDESCTNKIETSIGGQALVANGYKIYAKWVENQVEVTFTNANGIMFNKVTANTLEELAQKSLYDQSNHQGIDAVNRDINKAQRFSHWVYTDSGGTEHVISSYAQLIELASGTTEMQLRAVWTDKPYTINIEAASNSYGIAFNNVAYIDVSQLDANGVLNLSGILAEYAETAKQYDTNAEKQYYFKGWATDSGSTTKVDTIDFSATASVDVYAIWATKYTIKVNAPTSGTAVSVTYTVYISSTNGDGGLYATEDYTAAMSAPLYVTPGHYFKIFISTGKFDSDSTPPSSYTAVAENYSFTIGTESTNSGGTGCFTDGTLITLADGTQKRIEDLCESDVLLVFDHETGKFIEAPIVFIERDGWAEYNVINLKFSDGRVTRLIYEHGLFDLTLNKYVYITEENCSEFIGHEFAVIDGDHWNTVTLTEAFVTTEYVGCYSLVTAYHLNYFIDGLFSMPGGIEGLFNIFEYGDGLVYDEEQMQKDIEAYGLYTYEDFEDYIPEEVYYAFPAAYLKIAVGKGYLTFDDILAMIERYVVGNGLM